MDTFHLKKSSFFIKKRFILWNVFGKKTIFKKEKQTILNLTFNNILISYSKYGYFSAISPPSNLTKNNNAQNILTLFP
jgi:hypothetical protein